MPTAPVVTQQLTSNPTPDIRADTGGATVESFGGGAVSGQIVQASKQLAQTIGNISLEEKNKADRLAVMEFDNQTTKDLDNLYYNPKDGVVSRSGSDMKNTNFFGDFNTARDAIFAKNKKKFIRSKDQELLSNEIQERHATAFNGRLQNRFATEVKKYTINTLNASIATKIENGRRNFQVDGTPEAEIDDIRNIAKQLQDELGLSDEAAKLFVDDKISELHAGIIEDLGAAGKGIIAKEWFDEHKDLLTKDDEQLINKWIKSSSVKEEADLIAQDLMADGMGALQARAWLDKNVKNVDVRDAAMSRFSMRKEVNDREIEKFKVQRYNTAFELAEKSGDPDSISRSVWFKLTSSQRATIVESTGLKRNGIIVQTDPDTDRKLMDRLSSTDFKIQSEAAREVSENIQKYATKLSDPRKKEFQELGTAIIKRDIKATKTLNTYITTSLLAKSTLKAAGVQFSVEGKVRPSRELSFLMGRIQGLVRDRFTTKGQEPLPTDIQGIIDELVIEVIQERSIFNSKEKLFKVPIESKVIFPTNKVPADAKRNILRGLEEERKIANARGDNIPPVTEQDVANQYGRFLRGKQ